MLAESLLTEKGLFSEVSVANILRDSTVDACSTARNGAGQERVKKIDAGLKSPHEMRGGSCILKYFLKR